jgi:hypothetical protein
MMKGVRVRVPSFSLRLRIQGYLDGVNGPKSSSTTRRHGSATIAQGHLGNPGLKPIFWRAQVSFRRTLPAVVPDSEIALRTSESG